jgi:NAD(P)H-hydrate epimerase
MKILSAPQIQALDRFTIEQEPVASIDLMERASQTFVKWLLQRLPDEDRPVYIFAGTGNNGGDGLAIARLLHQKFFTVRVWLCKFSDQLSPDCATNLARLLDLRSVPIVELQEGAGFPDIPAGVTVVDAIFGSGLNRPVTGFWADFLRKLSQYPGDSVAVDIPSGLFCDRHTDGAAFEATHTLSFELPKLCFFFAENQRFVGAWETRSIGLRQDFIEKTETPHHLVREEMVARLLHRRNKFDHKGHFGHALLICGSYGKMGAAILAARACLRTGCGLVTVHVPKVGYGIMQLGFPEGMASVDRHEYVFTEVPNLQPFKSVGVGCGIGTNRLSEDALSELLDAVKVPLVIDADGLNILANNPTWLKRLPASTILTPHPREFERIFGESPNNFERNALQLRMSAELSVVIVLKGAYTSITTPAGKCFFNSTGNPGMATGGSGDVLTGILASLLAQGYEPEHAAMLGVYLHGLAGDIAIGLTEQESLLASDLVEHLGRAFHHLHRLA